MAKYENVNIYYTLELIAKYLKDEIVMYIVIIPIC